MKLKMLAHAAALTVAIGLGLGTAGAASVDLASVPLISGLSKVVPPNVYFILDDSTSMSWDYMPDDVNNNNTKRCFQNWGYNKIYYNPAIDYTTTMPPATFNSDGTVATTKPSQTTFTSVKIDGYGVSSTSTTDLSSVTGSAAVTLGNNPIRTTSGSKTVSITQASHGMTTGTSVNITGVSNSSKVNNATITGTYTITVVDANTYTILTTGSNASATGNGGGSAVKVTHKVGWWEYTASPTSPATTCAADTSYTFKVPTTTAEQRNYANWYAYYRTRINMMKSASGRAFAATGDKYRIGFDRISNQSPTAVTTNIKKFNATQKAAWYTALYASDPSPGGSTNYTPLRGALSKAGRLYAGKVITGNNDPVQYSCQQNFTILTTDGFWNLTDEVNSGSSRYGAYREDNTTLVGDWDRATLASGDAALAKDAGTTVRPYLDAGQYSNTLADIAAYYYRTDLRPSAVNGGLLDDGITRLDVSKNNVIPPPVAGDTAIWQHMTTYAMGLGVSGTLVFDKNYLTPAGDYAGILAGTKDWPNPDVTNTSNTVVTRIDDLWHAAVNGRGRYLSAANPNDVFDALNATLTSIATPPGSGAAAATSSLEPVTNNEFAYVAQFTPSAWYGDLLARKIVLDTGALSTTISWSARTKLAAMVGASTDTRSIFTFDSSTASKLKTFVPANLAAEKTAGYFRSNQLSQYATWTSTQQTAATDDAMINFLRGQNGLETQLRDRDGPLGDIVNSAPVYVAKPPFRYGDTGYADFATTNAGRLATVYVGANDGMLHAFDATTNSTAGSERWAYVPSAVIPAMYKLADTNYATNHQFYVDGQITVGDAYNGSAWKTVLIGGLGRGGRAFYALDVTDPDSPKALWEFGTAQDADMGYSYGNPVLTKRESDGRWVVLITSGYNNTLGDSKGRLYVLDAFTGAKLQEIITDNTVVDANISGIAKVNNFVLSALVDNTTQYIYGGDLGGSLWRFDLSGGTGGTSQRLARTSATVGNQPITVRPELSRIQSTDGVYHTVIYFGTGRYLGLGDLATDAPSGTVAQGIYAVKDTGSYIGVLTDTGSSLIEQTMDTSVTPRTIPNPVTVNWATNNGWYVTLPVGERVNVDLRLQLGTLAVIGNVPDDNYCQVGGSAWLYTLDFKSGAAVTTATNRQMGQLIPGSLATGLTLIRLPTNKLIAIVTEADTTVASMNVPVAPGAATSVRRVGWREVY
jgi:type IV pilus assembly protein PilY1